MKKTGYDQFFKAASQKARVQTEPNPSIKEIQRIVKAQRRVKPFPMTPIVSGCALIAVALVYLAHPDLMDEIVKHVGVRFIGQVVAEESPSAGGEKTAATKSDSGEKVAGAEDASQKSAASAKDESVAEDTSYIEKLRIRKEELDLREKELNQLEEELQRQKVEVDQRIRQLDQIRRDIASHLQERVDADDTQVNKLVDLYSSMKPKQAADVIGSLQEDLAVQVLTKMKKKSAAEVMNLLPAEKAKGLSEKLTGYKR